MYFFFSEISNDDVPSIEGDLSAVAPRRRLRVSPFVLEGAKYGARSDIDNCVGVTTGFPPTHLGLRATS